MNLKHPSHTIISDYKLIELYIIIIIVFLFIHLFIYLILYRIISYVYI